MRILVADDDEDIRVLWQKWYEESDCEVIVASDGKEAVKKAKDMKPSVCILDLKMPRMDGIEALRRIKKDSPETEVLLVTAQDKRNSSSFLRSSSPVNSLERNL